MTPMNISIINKSEIGKDIEERENLTIITKPHIINADNKDLIESLNLSRKVYPISFFTSICVTNVPNVTAIAFIIAKNLMSSLNIKQHDITEINKKHILYISVFNLLLL